MPSFDRLRDEAERNQKERSSALDAIEKKEKARREEWDKIVKIIAAFRQSHAAETTASPQLAERLEELAVGVAGLVTWYQRAGHENPSSFIEGQPAKDQLSNSYDPSRKWRNVYALAVHFVTKPGIEVPSELLYEGVDDVGAQ